MHVHQYSPSKVVHQKLSIPLKRKEKVTKMGEPIISLEQKKRANMGKMEKPRSNTMQMDIHPLHTHAHDQVLKMT